ncbi:GEVED domain-containing protein [Winogradskyella wichelsiae]|uniref:GEVED domain-containing protein n=1 Tax=Winogradskyella wichelsiae TaxID=2697007 RepID=UPI003EF16BDB
MKKNYSLFLITFLCFSLFGYGQITEGFETGMPTSYTTGNRNLSSGVWTGTNILRGTTVVNAGTYSCQIKSQTGSQITSPNIASGGLGTISFYGSGSTSSKVQVNYRINGGAWTPATGSTFSLTTTTRLYVATVNNGSADIEFQFYRTNGTVYIDDISTTTYSISDGTTSTSGEVTTMAVEPCGSESFESASLTSTYSDGSYTGDNGVTWTYVKSRDQDGDNNGSGISGNALMLRRLSDGSKVTSSSVSGGIANFSVKLYKGFTGGGDRQVALYIDGILKGTSIAFDDYEEHTFTVTGINISGNVSVELHNIKSKQVIVDDIEWTCYTPCTPPAAPTGTINGASVVCNSANLVYNVAGGTIGNSYWQSSTTGTSTINDAAYIYNVSTSGNYYVRNYNAATMCWSINAVGPFNLEINNPIAITSQPENTSATTGANATFSVVATNAVSYQWQVNTGSGWNNVTGGSGATTDTYTTAATSTPMDGNQYRSILTNSCGNTTSSVVTLNLTNEAPNNVRNIQGCFEDTSVTLNWDAPASGVTPTGYVVFARDGGTDPTGTKTDANTYTANTNFAAATPITPASLGRVVYKGIATTATITGLTEDNNYSFTVYAYVSESLTGWANGATAGSTITNGLAQGDITNLMATPLTNRVTLNWNNPLPTACWDQLIIVANQGAVTFTPSGNGSAYTGNDNDVYTTTNQLVYETTSSVSTKSITGLINGTNYCFKIFIRRGTTWTEGVETCATPTLTYCDSYGNGSDTFLTLTNNVQFNTIDNGSDNTDNAYSDYTAISTTVTLGQTYNLEVRVNTDGEYFTTTMVWIDWNNDGDFSDTNEDYDLGVAYNAVDGSTDASPLSIEVPSNAVIAATRMRVSTKYYDTDFTIDPPTPCETGFDGEVEDYTINIIQPVNAEINVKGNNISIANGFNTPYGLNNTLYASTNVGATGPEKTYFIENIGATSLNLTGTPKVEIIGAHASDFIVTLQPSTTIGSGSSSEFRIEFIPTSDGVRTAQVSIENSDSDENPYIFDIKGSAVCSTVLTSAIWPTEGPENTEITITSANNLSSATATINDIAMITVTSSASELVVILPAGATSGDITVLFSTDCSSANAFTVLNNEITSCETTSASTPPTGLFISQISDATTGSSSLIEIFNGTASTVNLNNYSIRVFNNGNGSPSSTLNLTGTIASGAIHVISIGTSSCDFSAAGLDGSLPHQAFDTASGINFDNDSSDLIELYNITTSTSIDVFGVFGSDNWANGLGTGDNGINFSRLNTASILPSTVFDLADWQVTDWTTCEDANYSNFGTYDFALATPPTVSVLAPPVFNCTNPIQISITATEGVTSGLELTYQWFYLEPRTSTFISIPNNAYFNNVTTSTLDLINPLLFIDYQFYCQIREDVATCQKTSNAVKLEIATAVWDGTAWSTPPGLDSFVIIDSNYDTAIGSTQTSFEACSCTITTNSELIINDNTYVVVENDLVVDGKLTINPYGSFVQINNTGTTSGNVLSDRTKIKVIKKTPILETHYEYVYWSAPVSGEQISNGLAEANANRIYSYSGQNYLDATKETGNNNATVPGQDDVDDNGDDWIFTNSTTIMQSGVGYAATQNSFTVFPTQIDYIFEGPFNNGIYNVPIYRNDSELNDNNWNLIGNPYPSAIDADLFLAANASIDQTVDAPINGALYFWSHETAATDSTNGNENLNYAQSDYAIINGSGETMGGDGITPNRFIPSGQAFFISMGNEATATTVSGNIKTADVVFNNNMRVTEDNNQFFRSATTDETNKLWLNLNTDNGAFNQILVAYVNGATDVDDGMYYDAKRNLSTEVNAVIYSLLENTDSKQFAIQGKNPNNLNLEEVIHLGFYTNIIEPTIYRISIHQLEGAFMMENAVYVNDKLLNTTHNLKNSDYTFTSETGEFNNRFQIVFNPLTLSIKDNIIDANTITITELQNGMVEFRVKNTHTIKQVAIIDLTGRRIYNLKGNSATEVYNLSKLSQAAYIAKITLSNGQVLNKKAIKQR